MAYLSTRDFSMLMSVLGAMAAGWMGLLIFAPWRWVKQYNEDRATIRRLAQQLIEIDVETHNKKFSSVLIDRDDDLGDLCRAVHHCLKVAASSRSESRHLKRTMRDKINKHTKEATAKLAKESSLDALTGVGNRRALEDFLDQIKEDIKTLSQQSAQTLIAVMIDMDHFKQVNDILGHEAGDEALVFLADLLRSTVRKQDHVVRMGGDEFLVLIRDETLEGAEQMANRLSSLFAQMPWPNPNVRRPTLSIGVAEIPITLPDAIERAVRTADEALYDAKRAGRDRVAVRAAD